MSTDTTNTFDFGETVQARAESQVNRVVAAADAQTVQRTRVVVAKPAKPAKADTNGNVAKARKIRTGTNVTVKAGGKAVAKRTAADTPAKASKPAAITLSPAEAKELAAKALATQQERVAKARRVLSETDQGNWELARITFEATEEDSPAKMGKSEWAAAIGVSPSLVSRWVAVHKHFGLPAARQTVGKGNAKRELSFNDHCELTKVKSPEVLAELKSRMLAEGTGLAVALKRYREEHKTGESSNGKDRLLAHLGKLHTDAVSGTDDKVAAFRDLGTLALKVLVAFRETVELFDPELINDDQVKTVIRNVLNEGEALTTAFEAALS